MCPSIRRKALSSEHEKTARLRAQRLAKEAAVAAAKDQQPTAKPKGRPARRSGGHVPKGARKRQPPLIAVPDEVKGG
jgi:hypothetical protein